MRAIFQTVKSPTQLKPVALLTAMTLALTACGTDSKPNIGGGNTANPTVNTTKTIQNTPVTFLADVKASNLSEGGELVFEITLTEEAKQAINNSDKADFSVAYTLTGNNIADSDKTGTVTLNKDNLSKTIKIPLKSDGKASDNNKISLVLSNPTTTATNAKPPEVSPLTATLERNIANSDSGVQIANATVTKGSGESKVSLVVSVAPNALDKDTKVFFDLVQGSAKENVHYQQPTQKFVVIKKGEKEATIDINLMGEVPTAPLEFSVKLLNTDNGTPLFDGKNLATVRIDSYVAEKAKLGALNDTGVTVAGNPSVGTLADCSGTTQDCHVGRDKTNNDDTDGKAGFSFTKLDKFGKSLTNEATEWACIKDNVTGLIWESKTYTPAVEGKWGEEANVNKDIRDAEWVYTYYDGKRGLGIKDTGKGVGRDKEHCGNEQHICSTEQYAVTLNTQNLCGVKNWRLPTRNEVLGIMNLSSKKAEVVLHKGWLFPNHMNDSKFPNIWTSSPVASKGRGESTFKFGKNVWVAYYDGTFSAETFSSSYDYKGVILVSNGQ
ncbi:Lcl domain-containing protein [Faucicola boevrei]|uniref:Lcl domain-containing protein n=1 Tax=Faucicola boevrei TaxID=346665 RepID=UPI000370EDEF|nr:DUF1566 domain-containing protein [Moraxella boevrei]